MSFQCQGCEGAGCGVCRNTGCSINLLAGSVPINHAQTERESDWQCICCDLYGTGPQPTRCPRCNNSTGF